MANGNTPKRIEHSNRHLQWIPIASLRINPRAQREFRPEWADRIAAEFNVDAIQPPHVNERGGHHWVMDGQHTIRALELVGWGDQSIQCWLYKGLTEEQEAEMFLILNNKKAVRAMDKFRNAVTAGRPTASEIDRVVRAQGLVISDDKIPGAIRAVTTVEKVYARTDSKTLGRTLRLVRDAYGDPGLEAPVIEGLSLLCHRYNGDLDDEVAKRKLGSAHGGVNGLLGKAETLRRQTGQVRSQCVAAAAVEIINAGAKGVKRLPNWWKS